MYIYIYICICQFSRLLQFRPREARKLASHEYVTLLLYLYPYTYTQIFIYRYVYVYNVYIHVTKYIYLNHFFRLSQIRPREARKLATHQHVTLLLYLHLDIYTCTYYLHIYIYVCENVYIIVYIYIYIIFSGYRKFDQEEEESLQHMSMARFCFHHAVAGACGGSTLTHTFTCSSRIHMH